MSKETSVKNLKPLPIGTASYKEAVMDCYCVDKTLLIRDILDKKVKVYLITRPRRFGKTFNMSMLQTFFENSGEDKSVYFKDKKIWKCGPEYTDKMGAYPVISISFKDARGNNWEECYNEITKVLSAEFKKRIKIADNPKLDASDREKFIAIKEGLAQGSDYRDSLMWLTELMQSTCKKCPIILIDEYDTPIQAGYLYGYYDKVIDFIRPFFSKALKDNANIAFAVLTGINRVSKESIFSGLNNLKTYSILDDTFSEYFGFTRDEVRDMFDYYGYSGMYGTACAWYDGYRFGRSGIFNPWSIINYIDDGASSEPKDYWINTSGNDIIYDLLKGATPEVLNNLIALLQGENIVAMIDENLTYPELKGDVTNAYSLLLMSGYLKTVDSQFCSMPDGILMGLSQRHNYCLAIPNEEVKDAFYFFIKKLISSFCAKEPDGKLFIEIWDAIMARDADAVTASLHGFLSSTASYFDTAYESFYQGFMLSVCAYKWGSYLIHTQEPSGLGRYDIELEPRGQNLPGIIIEVESVTRSKSQNAGPLEKRARAGLEQIKAKGYNRNLLSRGIKDIILVGIAFNADEVSAVIE
ncbi:MAG: ATP-binding protein [Clostridia bacterium]|nr:ATP-binding protein [Clostridia bacterium]